MWSHLGDVQETFALGRLEGLLENVCSQADPRVGIGRVRNRLSLRFESFYTTVYVNAAHKRLPSSPGRVVESGIVGFAFVVWFITSVYAPG